MKVYYFDFENLGFKALEPLSASITDKVFVFSNNEGIKRYCERSFYHCLSGYTTGPNQADFYIIAHLSRFLELMSQNELANVELFICTKDNPLVSAFEFQCNLYGVNAIAPFQIVPANNVVQMTTETGDAQVILSLLNEPKLGAELERESKLRRPDFTKCFNQLIEEGKVKRSTKDKKHWVLASSA
ncbi:hypothetical protein [Psychrobium sp. 1_MG-2023]|uniref:hypothetical protein n=1 Tax=Psychrobium sp. 1_MG-2023 TaxID=3062624 RepID=UPI000C327D9B|nr:hypothetical protein [Psychrobium sp. 1_MG-2023]MDP2560678.1 hypothetical protein [Psychrobium sp. 1_MG-2023]PKF56574.1 hypothetical protein CW748_08800 [Alteromonadales bacterium alter-6D02]